MERRQITNRLGIVLLVVGLITLALTGILWFYAFDAGDALAAAGAVGLTVSAATIATLGVGLVSYSRSHVATKWWLLGRRNSGFKK